MEVIAYIYDQMIFYKSAMKINGGNNTQMVYCPQMVLGQLDNYMQKEQIWIPNSHHIQKLPQNRSFCIQCELGIQIYSFACKYPVVPASFVENTISSSIEWLLHPKGLSLNYYIEIF